MLRVHFGDKALAEHREAIEAYCNIYLSGLTDQYDHISFSITVSDQISDSKAVYDAKLDGQPLSGEVLTIQTRGGDPVAAIENCFARARRSIIRQRKLADLAS